MLSKDFKTYDFVNLSLHGNINLKNCFIYEVRRDWIKIVSIDSFLKSGDECAASVIINIPLSYILGRDYLNTLDLLFITDAKNSFIRKALEYNLSNYDKSRWQN